MSVLRDVKALGARLLESRWVERVVRPDFPGFAIELTREKVIGVAVSSERGSRRLARVASAALPAGAFQPSLLHAPIQDAAAMRSALADVIAELPGFQRRLSLSLPDHVGKVSFLKLERTGMTSSEQAEVIRWKLKRSTPFRIEDALLSFQSFPDSGGDLRCMALIVQGAVVDSIESAFRELGVEVGLIDLSCFHLWNLLEPRLATGGDVLVLSVGDRWLTAIISRAGVPLMQRCKTAASSQGDWWDELERELSPTLLYYQDRIGGAGIERAVVHGTGEVLDRVREYLSGQRGIPADGIGNLGVAGGEALTAREQNEVAPAVGAALGR